MVSYWDSSAIIPLLIREPDTEQREAELRKIEQMVTWWGSSVEITSALARREREGILADKQLDQAKIRLQRLKEQWTRVMPVEAVLRRAERLLWLHPLRSADALQLAAALCACQENTQAAAFHCADLRLLEAAGKEGFTLFKPNRG